MIEAPDLLSATFSALADPTRRAILSRLADGPATVKELAAPFEMSGPAVSKHLRVLERAGLVARGKEAQWRPRTLQAEPLKQVAEWTGEFKKFWDASYARLDRYLETVKAATAALPEPTDRTARRDEPAATDSPYLTQAQDSPEPETLEAQGDGYSD